MQEIKTILVPIDFSAQTNSVLQSACMVARKFGAAIHVIFVVELLDAYTGFAVPHLPLESLEGELFNRAEKMMAEVIAQEMDPKVPCTSRVLKGKIAEEIVTYAREAGCDLIVISTHACRGVERAIFGSVTDRVIKTASCPVLSMNPCT